MQDFICKKAKEIHRLLLSSKQRWKTGSSGQAIISTKTQYLPTSVHQSAVRTATLFAANSKIAFKGRFQYFAAKGSHIPNKFSPNLDRAVLPYFRPASSPGKSVTAHFNLKTSPQHTTRLYYRSQRSDTRSRTSRAVVLDSVKLKLRVWFLLPFLARSRLGAVAQLCHRMAQPRFRRKARGQRRVPSEDPHFAAAN